MAKHKSVSGPTLTNLTQIGYYVNEAAIKLELYKLAVEMADRVSQRRQTANSFYLSINTLLVGGSAYLGTLRPSADTISIVSLAGVAICVLWGWNIASYQTLNSAKFKVIHDLEQSLPSQLFKEEWEKLDPDGDGKRHRPFHKVEGLVPWVFGLVYVVQTLIVVPWAQVARALFKH